MNEDDDAPTTVWDSARTAVRGKMHRASDSDRRKSDRLDVKDWLGYALAVIGPLVGAMLLVWQSQAVQDERIATLQGAVSELKSWNIKLSDRLRAHKDTH